MLWMKLLHLIVILPISGWRICDLADIWPLGADIWPLGEKIKIPPHYVFAYGHSTHFYVISAQSNENCWTSSRKYEKNTKNDKFFPRCDLDLDRVTLRPMPGYSCIQGQYTLQVSWNSDNGKVVKNPGQTDGRLDMIWLLHKVLTWFQAWKSHVAGWLLQRRLYPLFQCCGVDLLDIHLHTARARVTIIKFLIPLVFPIQFQPLPDEETVDRSHYIIKYCNLHQTRILEYK